MHRIILHNLLNFESLWKSILIKSMNGDILKFVKDIDAWHLEITLLVLCIETILALRLHSFA
jgi:hypothetical protein